LLEQAAHDGGGHVAASNEGNGQGSGQGRSHGKYPLISDPAKANIMPDLVAAQLTG
jgi:hypothetical protein